MNPFRTSLAAAVLLLALCSCQSPTSSNAGVTLSPTSGSVNQLLDVEVSGTFTKAISEPQWSTVFTLMESGQTTNLCTSYTYDASAFKVTCAHDALKNGTTYRIEIIQFIGCSGNQGSFTTIAAVAAVAKRAVAIDEAADGAYAITFTFDPPLSMDLFPSVTLEMPDGSLQGVQACAFDEERAALTCTVACPRIADEGEDCIVTLGGDGFEEVSLAIGEIEDEEENP